MHDHLFEVVRIILITGQQEGHQDLRRLSKVDKVALFRKRDEEHPAGNLQAHDDADRRPTMDPIWIEER